MLYHIEIDGEDTVLANAYGSFPVIVTAAKEALKVMRDQEDQKCTVRWAEVDSLAGGAGEIRSVLDITSEADICMAMLGKRFRTEKKRAVEALQPEQEEEEQKPATF